jgi:hypothetical protein
MKSTDFPFFLRRMLAVGLTGLLGSALLISNPRACRLQTLAHDNHPPRALA